MNKFITITKSLIKKLLPAEAQLRLRALFPPTCQKGKNSYIAKNVQLIGVNNITLGENTCISEHSWLNVNHRDPDKIAIAIGNNCFIGKRNFFSSGNKIIFGDYILTTNDCRFICSSHNIDTPEKPYITTGTTSSDSIDVGHNCFFGVGATVMGNLTIGHGSIVGAGAFLTISIPPFSIAVGNPAQVIKRYSFTKKAWIDIRALSEKDLISNPDEGDYLSLIQMSCPSLEMPLIITNSTFGNI